MSESEKRVQILLAYNDVQKSFVIDVTLHEVHNALRLFVPPSGETWMMDVSHHLKSEVLVLQDNPEPLVADKPRFGRMTQEAIVILSASLLEKRTNLTDFPAYAIHFYDHPTLSCPTFKLLAFGSRFVANQSLVSIDPTSMVKMEREQRLAQETAKFLRSRRLICIRGLWRHDAVEGLRMELRVKERNGEDSYNEIERVKKRLEERSAMIEKFSIPKEQHFEFLFRVRGTNNPQEVIRIFATIHYLQRNGIIPTDENNGVTFLYEEDERPRQLN